MFWFIMSILSAIIMILVVWANTGALAATQNSSEDEVFSEYEKMLGLDKHSQNKKDNAV